ncbi:MAG TPA: SDR family NAD(P)-dependent oxidoreductase [Legionella sp.]|nr:SDR family NAD(P)-dependent oxidoreductase [Legionella sp.]
MFIITGGGSGIGKALALALAKRDKSVIIIGRREELLKETAAQSGLIQYLVADVSTAQGLDRIVEFVKQLPMITALINNAGTINPVVSLQDMHIDSWHQTLNTNLDAALFLPQKLHDKLTGGRVLNIGSGVAYFPVRGWGAYCVSKAALSMLTRCWQLEAQQIHFASVMPGIVDTEMQAIARTGNNMELENVQFYQSLKQNNRLIFPEVVAEFLTWLLLSIDEQTFSSREWDIYDTSHHASWLKSPHQILHWDCNV